MLYLIIDSWSCPQFKDAFLSNPNFESDVNSLVAGLDDQSRRTVESIVRFVRCYAHVDSPDRHRLLEVEPSLCPFITPEDWLHVTNDKRHSQMQKVRYFPDLRASEEYILKSELVVLVHGLAYVPGGIASVKGKTVLDIGAYRGDSALVLSRICEPDHIYSFEPTPTVYQSLVSVVEHYKLKVTPVNCGAGANSGKVRFNASDMGWGQVSDSGNIEIPIMRVDDFVQENKVQNIGLIKVDTEGYEQDVLVGARETIRSHRPILLLSMYHHAEQFLNMRKWVEEIRSDYRYMIRRTNPQAVIDETYLICY